MYEDSHLQISIDADFECGSAGKIHPIGEGHYEIGPQPEVVPDWFYSALKTHFAGAGVPREYAFHVRVGSTAEAERTIRLRFRFSETNGRVYMDPPYWLFRRHRWRSVANADTRFEAERFGEVVVRLAPGEAVFIANKPYMAVSEATEEMERIAETGRYHVREIGRTAEDRPLLALETVSTGDPDETILVGATLQPAEPAARPVLAVAHWLDDGSALTRRLRERFRFCFLPLPNPDGTAHGRSVTNARDEVPMFSFGQLLAGKPAPAETKALWQYAEQLHPSAYIEFHTHYQDTRAHKLNPMGLEWFPKNQHERVRSVDKALLAINSEWRLTPIERSTPLCECGKFVNLTERLGVLSYCYQIYAVSEEATCAHATTVIATLARALAGPEWEAQMPAPKITPG